MGECCCVIGTLFKSMELKPSILKEISAVVSTSDDQITDHSIHVMVVMSHTLPCGKRLQWFNGS